MNKTMLKITRTRKDAIIPRYAHKDDSGLDLFSVDILTLEPGEFKLVKTGIKIELPENTEAQVRPRSGLAYKNGITVLNTPGTIDEGYRGEIGVILINHSKKTFHITAGMKIAQMVIMPVLRPRVVVSEELSETVRGEGGFGSTGNE
jgi:dUTP pyrophosphatase